MSGWLLPFLAACLWAQSAHGVTLDTRLGKIRGSVRTSRAGREYHAFTAIPYAKPPVGDLRFKAPQPYGNWDGERDGTKAESPMCSQIYFYIPALRNITMGQEDCLYLNVFTPKTDGKLPVLVHIHGGGWRCGNAGPASRADFMMDEDVVLVSLHYRLGGLGFLTTEDEVMPANLVLKDQNMALRWIKKNIKDFGGDPDSITIFGESAGAASVHYHMMSPMSKGLFHRGISMSGSNSGFWAFALPGEMRRLTEKVAAHLKCPTDSSKAIYECLMSKTSKEITDAERIFNFFDMDPPVVYRPIVELEAKDAFLTKNPLETETDLPWIIGMTSAEGAFKVASLLQIDTKEVDRLEENIEKWLPDMLMYTNRSANDAEITKKILEKYVPKRPIPMPSISTLFSDALFLWPGEVSLRKHKGPAYYYLYDHRNEASITDMVGPTDLEDLGVCHTDDLLSLFNLKDVLPKITGTEADRIVSEKYIKLWVNFARTGNPTPDLKEVQWKKFGRKRKYFHIQTDKFSMAKGLKEKAVKFWDSLPFSFPNWASTARDEL